MTPLCKATLLLAGLALGCAPATTTTPAPGAGNREAAPARDTRAAVRFAYTVQAAPLTYVSVDSGNVRMDIPGMGPMDVGFGVNATTQVALANGPDGLDATVTITALSGQMQNPQSGTTTVDNSMIPREPGRLTIRQTGEITSAKLPELSRSLREVTTASSLFRNLFVRLPANAVRPGDNWVDTVEISDQIGALGSRQRHEQSWTYVGDTVVGGRPLARLEAKVVTNTTVAGDAGGMQIEQRLSGQGIQWVLWDAARGVLVARRVESTSTGSMTVVGAGIGDIPLVQRIRSEARLQ